MHSYDFKTFISDLGIFASKEEQCEFFCRKINEKSSLTDEQVTSLIDLGNDHIICHLIQMPWFKESLHAKHTTNIMVSVFNGLLGQAKFVEARDLAKTIIHNFPFEMYCDNTDIINLLNPLINVKPMSEEDDYYLEEYVKSGKAIHLKNNKFVLLFLVRKANIVVATKALKTLVEENNLHKEDVNDILQSKNFTKFPDSLIADLVRSYNNEYEWFDILSNQSDKVLSFLKERSEYLKKIIDNNDLVKSNILMIKNFSDKVREDIYAIEDERIFNELLQKSSEKVNATIEKDPVKSFDKMIDEISLYKPLDNFDDVQKQFNLFLKLNEHYSKLTKSQVLRLIDINNYKINICLHGIFKEFDSEIIVSLYKSLAFKEDTLGLAEYILTKTSFQQHLISLEIKALFDILLKSKSGKKTLLQFLTTGNANSLSDLKYIMLYLANHHDNEVFNVFLDRKEFHAATNITRSNKEYVSYILSNIKLDKIDSFLTVNIENLPKEDWVEMFHGVERNRLDFISNLSGPYTVFFAEIAENEIKKRDMVSIPKTKITNLPAIGENLLHVGDSVYPIFIEKSSYYKESIEIDISSNIINMKDFFENIKVSKNCNIVGLSSGSFHVEEISTTYSSDQKCKISLKLKPKLSPLPELNFTEINNPNVLDDMSKVNGEYQKAYVSHVAANENTKEEALRYIFNLKLKYEHSVNLLLADNLNTPIDVLEKLLEYFGEFSDKQSYGKFNYIKNRIKVFHESKVIELENDHDKHINNFHMVKDLQEYQRVSPFYTIASPRTLKSVMDKEPDILEKLYHEDSDNFSKALYFVKNKEYLVSSAVFGEDLDTTEEEYKDHYNMLKSFVKRQQYKNVAYRVASKQISKNIKNIIVNAISKATSSDNIIAFAKLLDSDIGESLISTIIGNVMTYTPNLSDNMIAQKIAKEFRIEGMSLAGNTIIDLIIESITQSKDTDQASQMIEDVVEYDTLESDDSFSDVEKQKTNNI